jgi:hypothetical protein
MFNISTEDKITMGKIMKYQKNILLITILFCLFTLIIPISVIAEDQPGAELSILPDPTLQLPQIVPNIKNYIPLKYTDNFGLNWTRLQYFRGNDTIIQKLRSFFITRVAWPIIHPTWIPFLGYTRVVIDCEIVGDSPGWEVSINPNTISPSTDGTIADLNLTVYVNDLAAENTVSVRIKATRYTKTGDEVGTSYFEFPLRSANLEFFEIKPIDQHQVVSPDTTVYYQIEVTNLGYYVDTFTANITTDKDTKATLSQQSMVLYPGETRIVTLIVMTPDVIMDYGTIHTINISGFSINHPDSQTFAQVQVQTKGFYFSPLLAFSIVLILIIILIIFIIYKLIFVKREINVLGRPDKPWNLPEEKQHLENIKKKDPEEYNRVLKMMKDEYISALNWYESNKKAKKKSKSFSFNFISSIKGLFKRKEKPVTIKEEKIDEKKIEDKPKRKINILKKENNEIKKSEESKTKKVSIKLKDLMNNFSREKETKKKPVKEVVHEPEEPKTEKKSLKLKGLMNNFSREKETKKKPVKEVVFVPVEPKKPEEPIDEKSLEEQRKLKAFLKIKKAQDRQKRKMQKI